MEERKMRPRQYKPKRRVCEFCKDENVKIDYKNVSELRKYTTERGKIKPRRMSGVCAKHQRELAAAIKQSRVMALMPFVADSVK